MPRDPGVQPLPPELEERAKAIAATARFQFLLGAANPSFGLLSLDHLISIQKMIYTDGDQLLALTSNELAEVFTVAIPDPPPKLVPVVKDQSANSYTVASENPNLRVGGMVDAEVSVATANGAQMPINVHGFFVTNGGPWMQAAQFQGRWLLRDGYHRAYALLTRGITRVPCVIVQISTLQDLGAVRPGFVGGEVLLGDRPPLVADFVDESRSVPGSVLPTRKVIRIRAEEFLIVDS